MYDGGIFFHLRTGLELFWFLNFPSKFLKSIHIFSKLNMLAISWSYSVNLKPLSNTCWPIKRMLNWLSCCLKCQGLCFWIEVGILDSQLHCRARILDYLSKDLPWKCGHRKSCASDFGKVLGTGTLGPSRALNSTRFHVLEHSVSIWQKLLKPEIFLIKQFVFHTLTFLTSIHQNISSKFNSWVTGAIRFHQAILQQ